MADYGFTSHLLTIPVTVEDTAAVNAEIQSDLGFIDQGVTNPAVVIGMPVVLAPAQPDDTIIRVAKMSAGQKPMGILATKLKYDSNLNRFRCDMKCFGITLETLTTSVIPVGTVVTFNGLAPNTKYQLPTITTTGAAGSQMVVVGTRNPEANVFIQTVYIPIADVSNTATRLLSLDGTEPETIKPEK